MRSTTPTGRVLTTTVAAAVTWALVAAPAAAVSAEDAITLASISTDGTKGNQGATYPSVSADGTKVAFWSHASNLVDGDTNERADVFVKDLVTGELTLVSVAPDGTQGNALSAYPSLSDDGTKVAFSSEATNLVASDTDADIDVYVKDLASGQLVLASVDESGVKGDDLSIRPSVSANGSRVAFWSYASNWVEGDTELSADVFVKDLVTGDLVLASAAADGTRGNGHSDAPSVSADGQRVAFHSQARNLTADDTDGNTDVYVKDLLTGAITVASTTDTGTKGNSYSGLPRLSADGTRIAFESLSSNLDQGDTDGFSDVYVKDLLTGDLVLASATDGTKGDDDSRAPSLSGDGTRVAFYTEASNLVPTDTDTTSDVLFKNLTTGDLVLASAAEDGTKGDGFSHEPSLSADGTRVAFTSHASNLGEGDTDQISDVYVKGPSAAIEPPPPVDPAPTCEGRTATVYVAAGRIMGGPDSGQPYAGRLRGTTGADVIVGTPQRDRVLAGAGDDVVCTLGGTDTASGEAGADRLLGGYGNDGLFAGPGRDTVDGGYGDDRLTGGAEADRFIGGPGTDTATDVRRAQGDTTIGIP